MVVAELSIAVLLAALAGGALGAAIGALPALSVAGVVVLVGEATFGSTDVVGSVGLTETVGLGPALGPHVAFAGGVAAAAYAGRKGTGDSSFPYHRAKDVSGPLGSGLDVLLAGAIFGLIGVLLATLAVGLSLPMDPVALAVVLSAFGHRLAFGYPLLGRFDGDLLDMTPFERGDRRSGPSDEPAGNPDGRYVVEPWQPDHYEWQNVAALGVAVGLLSGYVGLATGSAFLAFGVTAASLLFVSLGFARFPVTHHMALPASIVALALPVDAAWVAVLVAGLFGLLGALFGELAQRALYAHADTHLDPSFASILATSLVLSVLASGGVLDPAAVPYPIL